MMPGIQPPLKLTVKTLLRFHRAFFFFFFFTAIQCTFTLFPSPNSTNVSKHHATHNSIIAITTFALISRPVSVHVTVNKNSGLIKYIHSTLTNSIPATLADSSCHSAH
jgi:hypothetical protein